MLLFLRRSQCLGRPDQQLKLKPVTIPCDPQAQYTSVCAYSFADDDKYVDDDRYKDGGDEEDDDHDDDDDDGDDDDDDDDDNGAAVADNDGN